MRALPPGPRRRAVVALGLVLAGCSTVATGEVRDATGAPVAGAVVHADGTPGCDAVTDAEGRWRTHCPAGDYTFTVSHPAHLSATVPATVAGPDAPVKLVVHAIPTEGGVHLLAGDRFVTPGPAPLTRQGSESDGWRWCVTGEPDARVPAGVIRALDNHVAEWRLFRVDTEGCAYRLARSAGDYWEYEADSPPIARLAPLAEGRDWLEIELTPGRYVVADWLADGFVPDGDGVRARWFAVTDGG